MLNPYTSASPSLMAPSPAKKAKNKKVKNVDRQIGSEEENENGRKG